MNAHLDKIGPSVVTLVMKLIREVDYPQKVTRLANIKRNHLYMEGKQYLLNRYGDGGRYVADYLPVTPLDLQRSGYDTTTVNAPVYNQVRSLARKFESALAPRSPNCQAEALVPGNEDQEALARTATKVIQALRKQWNADGLQKAIINCVYTSGTPFARVTWVEDPEMFGTREETLITDTPINGPHTSCDSCNSITPGIVDTCSVCKSPVVSAQLGDFTIRQAKVEEKTNGLPVPEIYSEENVTIPLMAKDWDREVSWLVLARDVFNGTIITKWPGTKGLIWDNGTEATQTAQAQMFRHNIRGGVRRMVTEVTEAYLTRDNYALLDESLSMSDGSKMAVGDFLREAAPEGIKVVIIRGHLIEAEAVNVKKVFSAAATDSTDTILSDPLANDYIPIQNAINTQMVINQEAMESILPMLLFNANTVDAEALRDSRGQFSGRMFPLDVDGGGDLKSHFYNAPQASPEPGVMQWTKMVEEMGKEIIGMLPAIYGGDVGVTQTAYEAERRLNQALQQLGIVWTAIRILWTGVYRNALRMLTQNETAALEDYGVTPEELEALKECFKGGVLRKIRISVEESIPATRAQVAALIREMLGLGPVGLTILGADSPAMASRVRDTLGLVGWSTPAATLQDWVRKRITQLLAEGPLPPSPVSQTGMPEPSIAPDPVFGDPNLIYQLGQNWLVSEGEKQDPNSPGYQNVLLWVKAYQEMAMAMARPEAEPGSEAGPAGAPAGGP